jgi:hypothetical protein
MRTIAPGNGSVADQLNACAIQLRECADLAEVEYHWPRLVRSLEAIAARARLVRRRGGEPAGLDGSLGWLAEVIHDAPGLQGPGGEPLRMELLLLVDRIAGR